MEVRAVLDTNVVVSSHLGRPSSPPAQTIQLWKQRHFDLLYSAGTLTEYAIKLLQLVEDRDAIMRFLADVREVGVLVSIDKFHERHYPEDDDDTAFLLCATNGEATHLVSYDRHLLDLEGKFNFRICRPKTFLNDLR